MTLADKVQKFFGEEPGFWYCKLRDCIYMHSSQEFIEFDKAERISWYRPSDEKKTVIPMCPHHGLPLNYSPEDTEIIDSNGVAVVLH